MTIQIDPIRRNLKFLLPHDKATSEFVVKAPAHYQVVSNGRLVEESDTGDGRRVTREGERFGAHLRFVDLPLETELAIARFLQA